jgi:cytochrome c-type biogenesis protein
MAGDVLNPLLGFAAGGLTILSPCVLPLVPVVLGSSAQQHRFGPLALASGLVVSFTAVGFALAVFGSRLGVDPEQVRLVGAAILAVAGLFLLSTKLQDGFARCFGPMIAWAGTRQQGFERGGLTGQAAIGALLGIVWSPCVGPTLGAAIALAAQGQGLGQVALTMAAFGAGIAAVLLVIALVGRQLFNRLRGGLTARARQGKYLLGTILLAVGLMILTGLDRTIEAAFVTHAPVWLINLSTGL